MGHLKQFRKPLVASKSLQAEISIPTGFRTQIEFTNQPLIHSGEPLHFINGNDRGRSLDALLAETHK